VRQVASATHPTVRHVLRLLAVVIALTTTSCSDTSERLESVAPSTSSTTSSAGSGFCGEFSAALAHLEAQKTATFSGGSMPLDEVFSTGDAYLLEMYTSIVNVAPDDLKPVIARQIAFYAGDASARTEEAFEQSFADATALAASVSTTCDLEISASDI
jgi:hypothetical protein